MSGRVSPPDRIRDEIDACSLPTVTWSGSWRRSPAWRPPDHPDRGGGRGDRVPRPGPLPARRHAQDARPGARNGYCPTTIKTTAGPVTIDRPKLRGTTERLASRLFGAGVTKTNALESLVIAGFVRGLSVRDVEATLADALGAEAG